MREVERSAASAELAVEEALAELGATRDEVEVELVQEPRSGVLGIGSQEAIVRVRLRGAPGEDGDDEESDDDEDSELDEQADVAADFLEGLVDLLGLPATVEINDDEGGTYVELWGEEGEGSMGQLIGRHGQTLESLQELVRGVVQAKTGTRCRVLVDVEDYRKRRRSQIVDRAQSMARRVQTSGRLERLDPMPPYERKLVHDAVAEMEGVETLSEGREPERRVVLRPASSGDVSRETP
jgi:spoIIIJ-associated protein